MKNDVPLKSSVGVIGAGIQGVCVSLHLIRKGFQVTLIDSSTKCQHQLNALKKQ